MNSDAAEAGPSSREDNTDLSDTQQGAGDDAPVYMKGWALASLTLAFMFICLVLALDNTILCACRFPSLRRSQKISNHAREATAIPQITSDFQSLNDIGWYGSSYLIAQMALLPTCGRLYTFFNVKWTYCISLAVFELGSIISAVAQNSTALIIGRAVSGLGAAGLVSGTTTIMSYCIALKKQAILTPIVLGMYGIGSCVGPLVGGAITDNKNLTWRFVFWINLRKYLSINQFILHFAFADTVLLSFWGSRTGLGLVGIKEPPSRC